MCGLVGMAGKLEGKHDKVFKDLLTICQVRGRDSTGAIAIRNTNAVHYAKMVGPPEYLLDSRMFEREVTQGFNKVLMGHTRAKTIGEASWRNAHPFDFDTVIGMHNGTLRGEYNMENRRQFNVDSEWLYWFIDRYGIEEAIPQIDGAWSLTWWNKEDNTLNFLRNDERPLWLTYTKDMKVLMWASEPWFFGAAERVVDLWDGDGGPVIFSTKVNQLLTFKIDHTGTEPNKIFSMAAPKELKGKEVRRYSGNHWPNGRWVEPPKTNSTTGSTASSGGASTDGGEVTDPFLGDLLNPEEETGVLYLTPKQRQERAEALARRKRLAESTTSSTALMISKPNASINSGTKTDKTSSTHSCSEIGSQQTAPSAPSTPTSNVVPLNSSVSRQRNSGGTLSLRSSQAESSPMHRHVKPLVDRRKVAGIAYITDRITGIELEEEEFRRLTGNACVYCKTPEQPLSKVHHIFAPHIGSGGKPDKMTYLCSDCVAD